MSAAVVRTGPAPLHCGLHVPNFGTFAPPTVMAELARTAEEAGWDGVFVWDHVVRKEGDLDVADPWVAIAAMAVATQRVQLGPLVTPLPRRRPWNVAKAAVTLDHLSAGRMVLGVGLGTPRGPEFPAFGEEMDLRRRGDLLDEAIEIVRRAWTGEPVEHAGHWRVDGVRFLPTPVRPSGIPVWAATESIRGRAVRRAAVLDGIFPIGIEPAELGALLGAVAEARRAAGLPQGGPDYEVATSATDHPGRWEGSGLTWWLRELPWDEPVAAVLRLVEAGPPR
jgi:alkanesulfonate monooxygenase SsuD/methylene tetrahydromethanopterin reductase-like flavin-dependent oxidoreductase (luciferase family)